MTTNLIVFMLAVAVLALGYRKGHRLAMAVALMLGLYLGVTAAGDQTRGVLAQVLAPLAQLVI